VRSRPFASCRASAERKTPPVSAPERNLTAERHEAMAAELRLIAHRLVDPNNVRALLARALELDAKAAEVRQNRFYASATRDMR
jgi:hypothetical protein